MKFKALFKKKAPSWKDVYEVGRDTYGEPTIMHWGEPITLKVGSFCSIAGGVKIFLGGNHRTDWITTFPFSIFRESAKHITWYPESKGDVLIGSDVWIGEDAVILSGVNVGNGSVIGASSVVASDVAPYSIVAGNPAKTIRMRFSEENVSILQSLKWWEWNDSKIDAAMPNIMNDDVTALQNFSVEYDQKNHP